MVQRALSFRKEDKLKKQCDVAVVIGHDVKFCPFKSFCTFTITVLFFRLLFNLMNFLSFIFLQSCRVSYLCHGPVNIFIKGIMTCTVHHS